MQNNTMQNNCSPLNYPSTNQAYEYIQQNYRVSDVTSLYAAETQNYAVENFSGPPSHQANDAYNHNLYSVTNVNMPQTISLRPNEQNNCISHDYSFNRPSAMQQGPSYYTQQLDTDSTNNMQHNTLNDGLMALIDDLNLDDYGITIEPPIEENHQINPQLNSNMQPQFCNFRESGNPVAATSSLPAMFPTQQQALSNFTYITGQNSDTAITNGNTHTQNYAVENFSSSLSHQANDTYNYNSYSNMNMPLTTSLRPNEQNNNISNDYSFNRPSAMQQGPSSYTQQLDTDSTNNMQHNTLNDELMALIDDLFCDEYSNITEPAIEENHQINPQLNLNMQPQFCNFSECGNPEAATSTLTATQQQALSNYTYITGQYSDTAITNGNTTTARRCERSSSTSSSLDDNCIKLSNGQYKCRLCDKLLLQFRSFKIHYKCYHNGDYPYRCEVCGKRFQLEEVFTRHQSKHKSEDKEYKCHLCPSQYHYKSDLKRHVNVKHTLEKLFTCEICNKSYTRRDHLLKHQKTHNK